MQTITIPTKQYEVLQREAALYRTLFAPTTKRSDQLKIKTETMTAKERRAVYQGRRDVAKGNYFTLNDLKQDLARRRRPTR